MSEAKLIQVIETSTVVGSGSEASPSRRVMEYWTPEGKLLAVNDPLPDDWLDIVEDEKRAAKEQ